MNENNYPKKKSEDKPKEETTPFTLASQKVMLASLLFSKEAPEDIQDIRPKHFESVVVRDMVKLACDFYEKYSRLPNPDEYQQCLTTYLNSKEEKDLPAPRSEYLNVYDEVLSFKEEDFEPVQDSFRNFARFQAHNEALDKIIEKRMVEKEDYDGIQKLMTEAYATGSRGGGLVEKDLSEVPENLDFLVKGRIPKGGITFIAGKGGTGKGAFTMGTIGAAVTTGGVAFEGEQLEQGFVFLFNEEDFESTVLNRLKNNAGSVENLKWLELAKDRDGFSATFSLKHNIPLLIKKLKQVPEALLTNSLLVIDGIGTFMGMKIGSDAYNDVTVRNVLTPLSRIARQFNMAVVIIGHFNKSKTSELVYAIMGSKAFVNISRAVYAIIEDEEERERHYFLPLKVNSPEFKNTGIEFVIEEDTDKIIIKKELSPEDVADLKAERQPGQQRTLGAGEKARLFLEEELRRGGKKPKDLEKKARESLVCGRETLYRIMNRLRKKKLAKSIEDGFGNVVWVWIGGSAGTKEKSEEKKASEDAKRKVDEIRKKQKEEIESKVEEKGETKTEEQKRSPEEEVAISEERKKQIEKIRKKHQ